MHPPFIQEPGIAVRKTRPITRLLAVLFWLVLICISSQTFSQQYSFIRYSLKEGLVQSQVRCLYQDSRGYIWAGTLGGVSRFDGRDFTNWDVQDGLPANQVSSFCELPDGTMAVGTIGSVSFLTNTGIRTTPLRNEWKETTVNSMTLDNEGRLWIGTENGLCFLEDDSIRYLPAQWSLSTAHIKSFYPDKGQGMLVTSKDKVIRWDGSSEHVFYTPRNADTNLFDLEQTSDGSYWLATKGEGLVHLSDDGTFIASYGPNEGLFSSTITGLIAGDADELWITSRFGFFHFDGTSFTSYAEKNGLTTPDVRDALIDREGNLWLASYGNGLLKFTGEAFSYYTRADGLSSNAVMSICQDSTGGFWFSTFDQGICRQRGDSIQHYDLRELTVNSRTWTSLCDRRSDLWFGTSDGLLHFSHGKFTRYTEEDSLPDRTVLCLYEDSRGRILVGTAKGICVFSEGHFHPLEGENIPSTRVRSIAEDRIGNTWMATREGVYRHDGKHIQHFGEEEGLKSNTTYCVEVDPFNRIWVGTQFGLALYLNGRFQSIGVGSTSGSNSINFLKYHLGKLWIGTNNGLYYFEAGETLDQENIEFDQCGLDDGLISLETNLNAVFVDHNRHLWFGTPEGVMKVNEEQLEKLHRPYAPEISITRVQLNLQDPDWKARKVQVNAVTGLPVDLRVTYKDNYFTFFFTGISFTYPENVRYQFMLEGFDDDWKALTEANFTTYSNLPYDHFTFRVRAISKQGAVSNDATFDFEVLPPFWLTWWFVLFEFAVVTGIVTAIFYYRKKIITARHENEKSEMRSKMLALEQQSLNSSLNRHFIFNALNSIQYYINRQDRLAANRYLSDFAKLIRKNLDSSTENLTTLREEVERLELYLKLEHMRFKDKFEYHIHVDESLDQDAIKVPAMLLQPFLENSIWHGLLPLETPGRVDVDITRNNGSVEFTITDNGIGIDNSMKNKSGLDNHISKGMQITTGRIELIKKMTTQVIDLQGPYQLHDAENRPNGTQVRISLPINFNELFPN